MSKLHPQSHTILLRQPLPKYNFKGKKLPKDVLLELPFPQCQENTPSQLHTAPGLSGHEDVLSIAARQSVGAWQSEVSVDKSPASHQANKTLAAVRPGNGGHETGRNGGHETGRNGEHETGRNSGCETGRNRGCETGRKTTKPTAAVAARVLRQGDKIQGVVDDRQLYAAKSFVPAHLGPVSVEMQQLQIPSISFADLPPGSPVIPRNSDACSQGSSRDDAVGGSHQMHGRPQLMKPLHLDVGEELAGGAMAAELQFPAAAFERQGDVDGSKIPVPEAGLLVRAVQGPTDADKLQKAEEEIDKLASQLEVQLQVNAELKRLLVASVGEDFERRIENLARDRAQLVMELGDYTKKVAEDYEHLDQISIQADMWRSKYLASRVMVEGLASARAFYSVQFQDSQQAMQQLLNERYELRADLLQACKCLQQVKGAFDPLNAQRSHSLGSTNVVDVARNVRQLSEAVRFRLLPANISSSVVLPLEDSLQNSLTKAEKFASELLSRKVSPPAVKHSMPSGLLVSPRSYERFHPQTRHDNLTLQCCPKCKGEMSVV